MIDNLPSRIENRLDPDYRRRKRRFHPMMFEEIIHMEMEDKDSNFGFLVMISIFKDDFSWLHEIGLETYRGLKSAKTEDERVKLIENFERALEMIDHPIYRDMYGKSEDMYIFVKEIRHSMRHYLDRYLIMKEKK